MYRYRKLTLDMRDMGDQCSRQRMARLLRCEGIKDSEVMANVLTSEVELLLS